jgi:ABC-2 type transport system ATP-binding protein
METILKLNNISKHFGKQKALNNVSMNIQKGDIYGLIGRNGAGKTTLLKTIVTLSNPKSGTVQLFGSQNDKEYLEQLKRTGSVIETPVAYDQLTADQNLKYYCKLRGITDKNTVSEALKFVGLEHTNKKKFKNFSLGMKQKLGLAIALLNKPDFLILDEPINGLDPIAIVEFRDVLIRLNKEHGITILISSHILSELYQVANRFGILNEGTLVKEISKDEFEKLTKQFIHIQVDNTEKACVVLQRLDLSNFKVISSNEINVYETNLDESTLNEELVKSNIKVLKIYKDGMDMEEYFKALISGNQKEVRI